MESGKPLKVIDVRSAAEFEAVHIPGAYNVPLNTLGEHREELRTHLDEPVALVCRSGQRAAQAERLLAEVGMANVHILDGGIIAWEQSGGPVRRGKQRWDIERQVRLVAGLLVLAGVLGSLIFQPLKFVSGAVGAGLAVAALTNSCMMGACLARLPYNRAATCDVNAVVAELTGTAARTRTAA
jgi:rhodanese-related sulfurtransferase